MHQLIDLVEKFARPKVALVGDFMLDCYVYGDTERISPEAPVPVLRVVGRESRVGGAGSVAANVAALGGQVACIGVIGQDDSGDELLKLLSAAGADVSGLTRLPHRPTIRKQRVIGLAQHRHRQQMLRIDEESVEPLPPTLARSLRAALKAVLPHCKAVAFEDYEKGVLTDETAPALIADARAAGLPVLVDPARLSDYGRYRGATLLTPNRAEAQLASGIRITDEASLEACAQRLIQSADAQAMVITLDREGAYLALRGKQGRRIATRPRSVYDVTGAGDAVLAMLAVAVAEGVELHDAVALANLAGGLEVERFGVVPITRAEVVDELRRQIGLRGRKVLGRRHLAEEAARRRQRGDSIVFTNGCFDLLHMGHVRYLQEARQLGSCLIVAINSDASVRRLKGPSRPVCDQDERAEMLGALECVDFVTIFDEDTPMELLQALRPDILVKGGTTPVIVGRELVESYGGRVQNLSLVEGLSTTDIINRIVGNNTEK